MPVLGLAQLWEDLAEGKPDWGAYALRNLIEDKRNHGGELPALEGTVLAPQDAPPRGELPAPTVAAFYAQRDSPWRDIGKTLAEGRNNGTMRLAASIRQQTAHSAEWAVSHMTDEVWPEVERIDKSDEFSYAEFTEVIRAVWRQYPSGVDEARKRALAGPPPAAATAVYNDPAPVGAYVLPRWEAVHELPASTLELKDAYLVNRLVRYVLFRRYVWARGLAWMSWNGQRWEPVDESVVRDAVREYFVYLHGEMLRDDSTDMEFLKAVTGLLSAAKISAAVKLCQGHHGAHIRDGGAFDARPDLLNTPSGVVDLRSGAVTPHNPELLLTKVTRGSYRPGLAHPDWEQALTALDAPERAWFQMRIGQAVTGHPPSDGVMPVLQGSGENGKTALTTDGPVRALGDYADMASHKLIASVTPGRSEHSTEMADLRGQRLLLGEELAEGRSIDVTALKRIQDVGMIKARLVHKDNMTFPASHTLFVTTNYTPQVAETDHGTWRRLALLKFPYSFRKPGEPLESEFDRPGDPGLKSRIKAGGTGQHDAIVTWAVEGAIAWYERGMTDVLPTEKIAADTLGWRKESDIIWRWLDEHMAFRQAPPGEHPYCVAKEEAFDDINARLTAAGKMALGIETFSSRLEGHEEYRKHGLGKDRTARLSNLSRRPVQLTGGVPRALGNQVSVITGLVFKLSRQDPDLALAGVAGVQVNSPRDPSRKQFAETPATPASARPEPAPAPPPADYSPSPEQTPPAAPKKDNRPEKSENAPNGENPDSPPGAKAPRSRLTAEEKAGRETARKAKAAQGRLEARAAKVAELGGPLVRLPAVVLRDQSILPLDPAGAAAWLEPALGELSVDVEHSGYPLGHPAYRLRLVQLGNEHSAVVLDPHDPAQADVIRGALERAAALHAHSANADLGPLAHAGLGDLAGMWARMYDTVHPAKLIDPALTDSDEAALKPLARRLLGDEYALSWKLDALRKEIFAAGGWIGETEFATPVERSGWAMIPLCEAYVRYAGADVLDAAAVFRVLGERGGLL